MQTLSECFRKRGGCLLLRYCLVVRDVHSCWTETHTACQTGLTWPSSQSCCLGSLGSKISYFRFRQRSGGWIKTVLSVWWNNTSRELASNIHLNLHFSSFFCYKVVIVCIASFLDIKYFHILTSQVTLLSDVWRQTCLWWRCTECYCMDHWSAWPSISQYAASS